jgi:hypothetical protein
MALDLNCDYVNLLVRETQANSPSSIPRVAVHGRTDVPTRPSCAVEVRSSKINLVKDQGQVC